MRAPCASVCELTYFVSTPVLSQQIEWPMRLVSIHLVFAYVLHRRRWQRCSPIRHLRQLPIDDFQYDWLLSLKKCRQRWRYSWPRWCPRQQPNQPADHTRTLPIMSTMFHDLSSMFSKHARMPDEMCPGTTEIKMGNILFIRCENVGILGLRRVCLCVCQRQTKPVTVNCFSENEMINARTRTCCGEIRIPLNLFTNCCETNLEQSR